MYNRIFTSQLFFESIVIIYNFIPSHCDYHNNTTAPVCTYCGHGVVSIIYKRAEKRKIIIKFFSFCCFQCQADRFLETVQQRCAWAEFVCHHPLCMTHRALAETRRRQFQNCNSELMGQWLGMLTTLKPSRSGTTNSGIISGTTSVTSLSRA